MKPSRSIGAFVAALSIHIGIVAVIWFALASPFDRDDLPPPKERFAVRFGETVTEEEESASSALQASPPAPSDPAPPAARVQPAGDISDTTLIAPQKPQPRAFSEADRDSLPYSVLHHYGEEFFNLSAGEQHYIVDNLQRIRKINEIVGTRLLRERPDDVDPHDSNVVEFTLRPDGTISDLHLEKNRIGTPLDELTLQTINLAHPKYPKPDQPTKVRIRVYIIVK